MRKKLLSVLAALACAAVCAFSLTACDDTVKIGFVYRLNDDGASYAITGMTYNGSDLYQATKYKKGMPEEITVPAEYDGKPVTVITSMGIGGAGVKKVVLPAGITEIGGFSSFEDLESINIGDDVKKISENAFNGLTKLEPEIGENSKLETVGKSAFSGTKIKSFKAPATLKFKNVDNYNYENDYLFDSCTELETVDLSAMTPADGKLNVYIGNYFAKGCSKLKTVILPKVRISASEKAFDENSASVTTVYSLYDNALEGAANWFPSTQPESTSCIALGKICYYSETEPTGTSTYWWHYVNGVPTKWR